MFNHTFIFSPGTWFGEGKILLNMVEEELVFNTNWAFYDFQTKTFTVDMENQKVGRIVGTGVYDEKMIAWEFRNNDMNFEGYETYTLQNDGSYWMKGEYVTSDQFRTQIEARIWPQSKEAPAPDESQENEEEP